MTALSSETAISSAMGLHDVPKFRQSCDKCQNSKIRCSRDKPVCKRCAQRRFRCIYSPQKRTGRPKKIMEAEGTVSQTHEMDVDEVEEDGSLEPVMGVASLLSPESETPVVTSPYGSGAGHPDSHVSNTSQMRDSGFASVNSCGTARNFSLSPTGNDALFRSAVDAWISDPEFSAVASHGRHVPEITHQRFRGGNLSAAAIPTQDSRKSLPDCHAAVLAQAAKLEQALSQAASPPTIDIVLGAEGDFSSLRHRLFTCNGHQSPVPENTSPQAWAVPHAIPSAKPCLATDRPVLLSLALLAERVIGMLEDMFHLAAKSAQTMDQASDFIWSGAPGMSAPSARRLQRSLRNVAPTPCVSLEMDSYRALRLDDFSVEGQAKTNAMSRILKLRVDRMLKALEALDSAKQTKQRSEQMKAGRPSGSPLDWGGSTAVLDTMTGTLLDDLLRRMESLQGAMVLL
ncbi:hypothetical protein F4777DRAFT_195520 [Nemania sp. FL0916]|nr:hypothetical protein F4777DRAFT_195520 [Nemania sp. FL0916]